MLLSFLLCVLILYVPLPAGPGSGAYSWTAWGVVALALANCLACWVGLRLAGTLQSGGGVVGKLRAARVFLLLQAGVAAFVFVDVFVLHWPSWVGGVLGGYRWLVLADDFVLLLPALIMTVTVMCFQHRFEFSRGRISLSLAAYLRLRLRVELMLVLAPWALMVGSSDLVYAVFAGGENAVAVDTVSSVGILLLIVVFGPALLRFVWKTSRLADGPLRDRLEALGRQQGFRCRDILVWHTHNHLPNAAVAGFVAPLRYVLITDALLEICTDEEVEAVFAHEIGHARRRHAAFYVLFACAFVFFYANLIDLLSMVRCVEPLGDIFLSDLSETQALVMILFAVLYWLFVFGFMSRRMEQEADLFSIRATGNPSAFIDALRKLSAMSGVPEEAGFWRHFSIARRTKFLHAALDRPEQAAGAVLKLRLARAAVLALLVLSVARLVLWRGELFTF